MPCLARPAGAIEIHMYYRDHNPPHFHVIDGGDEALIRIADMTVLKGALRSATLQAVKQWTTPNRQALLALNWILAQAFMAMRPIP